MSVSVSLNFQKSRLWTFPTKMSAEPPTTRPPNHSQNCLSIPQPKPYHAQQPKALSYLTHDIPPTTLLYLQSCIVTTGPQATTAHPMRSSAGQHHHCTTTAHSRKSRQQDRPVASVQWPSPQPISFWSNPISLLPAPYPAIPP